MQTLPQFIRYAIVGCANVALDFMVVNLLSIWRDTYSGSPIVLISTVSAAAVITQSYVLNKHWTFRAGGQDHRLAVPRFIAVNMGAFVLNTSIVYAMTTFLAPPFGLTPLLWLNVVKVMAIAVVVVWNFSGFKYIVFRAPPL